MRVPLLHLLLACMCMCVRVYVCCTIQTIIYDTRRIEKREENEKEWRERFDDELREKNASTILCRFFHGRNGDKDPLLFYSLYLSRSTLLDLFSSRRRVYGKIVSKQCFSKLCSLRGEWLSTFELSRAAVLLTLLNLYGVYMHGHVLAGAATIRARLGVNIYRVDARISHVRTANWWKLEYRTTGRTRSPRFFLGCREISNFFFPLFPSFFFFGRASR